mgnify:FL=1|jgi:hypothetical protein|tara:strand:- start:39 stop:212 length:174 start_codon:yes stop_codon:yes gene_type:complete
MGMLEYLMIRTGDDEYHISTEVHKSKTLATVARKLKDKDVLGIIKIDEGEFLAFIME